jgi:CubicO group peptidase (beta-lactamase class C family)
MTVPAAIQDALQSAVDDGVFPGAVLAVRVSGGPEFTAVVGRLSSEQTSPPVSSATIYDLASLTKPLVTVTSILLLVQRSKLSLADTVQTILPECDGSAVGPATVRDLLTHSTGLPGWRPFFEQLQQKGLSAGAAEPSAVRQALLQLICNEPLIYARGTKSLYSDLGFILLGFLVERTGGRFLDQWFQEEVAKPLGAAPLLYLPTRRSGSAGESAAVPDARKIAPTGWDERRHTLLCGEVHDDNAAAMGGVAGHAGLFGTADSVLAVSRAWLQARQGEPSLLDRDLVRLFTTRNRDVPESSWALGWDTPSPPSSSGSYLSSEAFGHLGYTGTSLWVDPRRSLEVVLLSNRVNTGYKNERIRAFRPRIHDLIVQECGLVECGS